MKTSVDPHQRCGKHPGEPLRQESSVPGAPLRSWRLRTHWRKCSGGRLRDHHKKKSRTQCLTLRTQRDRFPLSFARISHSNHLLLPTIIPCHPTLLTSYTMLSLLTPQRWSPISIISHDCSERATMSGKDRTRLPLPLCALRGGEVGFVRLRHCGWAEVLLRRRWRALCGFGRERWVLLCCRWRWRARAVKLGSRYQFLGCEHERNLEPKKTGNEK